MAGGRAATSGKLPGIAGPQRPQWKSLQPLPDPRVLLCGEPQHPGGDLADLLQGGLEGLLPGLQLRPLPPTIQVIDDESLNPARCG